MNNLIGIEKWRALDGDNTLALDWPLDENSHVWEIGGYEGRWVQQIWNKFHCNITVFEPQLWAVERMRTRFAGIDKIDIRDYGLWLEDGKKAIGNYNTDGATIMHPRSNLSTKIQEGEFRDFYWEILGFEHSIDLALMNIEGAEYALIPAIVESGVMSQFNYFWCQFHPQFSNPPVYPHYVESVPMDWHIYEMMGHTHDLLWDCYPTAVAWKRR